MKLSDLTPRQREEMQRLSAGDQSTYGRGRARVQNILVRLGLAEYEPNIGNCRITASGRKLMTTKRAPGAVTPAKGGE